MFDQFLSWFVVTLTIIAVPIALGGAVLTVIWVWRRWLARIQVKNLLRRIPQGTSIIGLAVYGLPFLVLNIAGFSIQSILGIAAAGAVVGALCAGMSFVVLGKQVIGKTKIFLLSIVGGTWISSMTVAALIVMTSD